jgi:hypothetical protein
MFLDMDSSPSMLPPGHARSTINRPVRSRITPRGRFIGVPCHPLRVLVFAKESAPCEEGCSKSRPEGPQCVGVHRGGPVGVDSQEKRFRPIGTFRRMNTIYRLFSGAGEAAASGTVEGERLVYLGRCTMHGPGALRISPALCAQTLQAPWPRELSCSTGALSFRVKEKALPGTGLGVIIFHYGSRNAVPNTPCATDQLIHLPPANSLIFAQSECVVVVREEFPST